MRAIDRIACTSRLARVSATEKASFSLGLLLLALALPPWPASLVVLFVSHVALWAVARVQIADYLKVVVPPSVFLMVSVLPLAVSLDTNGPGLVRFTLGEAGLSLAGSVALRVAACLHCLLFLALTTPMPQLLMLMRRCRIPPVVAEVSLLVYRYVWLFLDTLESLHRAQTARLGYATARSSYRSAALLAVSLLDHALQRGRELERGLEARSWQGELRVLYEERPASRLRLAGTAALAASILAGSLAYSLN